MTRHTKVEATITDDGDLKIGVYDLLGALGNEGKKAIVEYLAVESPVWEEIKKQLAETFSAPNYDSRVHELRLAFMRSEHFPDNAARVVENLLQENANLQRKLTLAERNIYRWEKWFEEHNPDLRYSQLPIQSERCELTQISTSQATEFLASQGIDLLQMQEEAKDEIDMMQITIMGHEVGYFWSFPVPYEDEDVLAEFVSDKIASDMSNGNYVGGDLQYIDRDKYQCHGEWKVLS